MSARANRRTVTRLLSGPQNQASATVAVSYLLQSCCVTRLTSAWGCASGGERRAYVGCCESIGGASDIIGCVASNAGGAGFIAEHRIVGSISRDALLAAQVRTRLPAAMRSRVAPSPRCACRGCFCGCEREKLLIVMHCFVQKSTSKVQTARPSCRLASSPRNKRLQGVIALHWGHKR